MKNIKLSNRESFKLAVGYWALFVSSSIYVLFSQYTFYAPEYWAFLEDSNL